MTSIVPAAWPGQRDRLTLKLLAESIRGGQCVLLLGPGAATHDDGGVATPLESLLIDQLLADIEAPPSVPADGAAELSMPSLPLAAERWLRERPNRDAMAMLVGEFYKDKGQLPSALHESLARLPFRICISTTFDDQMREAFQKAGKSPRLDFYGAPPRPPGVLAELPGVERPLVYHLFGHPQLKASMALRENELIRTVASIVRDQPPLPDIVRAALADPQTSCLFLGFGIYHWHLRLLLEVLQVFSNRSSQQLALEHARALAQPGHREAVEITYDRKALELQPLNSEVFAQALLDAYGPVDPLPVAAAMPAAGGAVAQVLAAAASAAAAAPAATVVAPTAVVPVALPPGKPPLVFLSYASEDVEHVTQLGSELEARGLKVWRDGQGLRAGDNWYKQLESLISKVVDYVVVVQTPAMTSRIEGVFFWEIDEALKRQKTMGFAGGGQLRFLIPVRLGAGDPLPDLASLHQIEVSSAQGMDRLAASLAEDWALRASKRAAATVAA